MITCKYYQQQQQSQLLQSSNTACKVAQLLIPLNNKIVEDEEK